ncbi:hypothetical protein ABL78_3824 [Leptomonas seymouri]|uniref:Transmembrane protein n=1 Tax=Leptomonas seymouri TaxID=5684 RepID=A0A0N1PDH7_LEPSE|nr:hypothetical protein ABL78_3824 [Leptomonas seymouri]|eukprot:KPI87112.1 hypothetical protein ABL78_3824 [Leptomonas seymouri]
MRTVVNMRTHEMTNVRASKDAGHTKSDKILVYSFFPFLQQSEMQNRQITPKQTEKQQQQYLPTLKDLGFDTFFFPSFCFFFNINPCLMNLFLPLLFRPDLCTSLFCAPLFRSQEWPAEASIDVIVPVFYACVRWRRCAYISFLLLVALWSWKQLHGCIGKLTGLYIVDLFIFSFFSFSEPHAR